MTKWENSSAFLGMGDSIPRNLSYIIFMILLPLAAVDMVYIIYSKQNLIQCLYNDWLEFDHWRWLGQYLMTGYHGSVTDFPIFDFVIFHTEVSSMGPTSPLQRVFSWYCMTNC